MFPCLVCWQFWNSLPFSSIWRAEAWPSALNSTDWARTSYVKSLMWGRKAAVIRDLVQSMTRSIIFGIKHSEIFLENMTKIIFKPRFFGAGSEDVVMFSMNSYSSWFLKGCKSSNVMYFFSSLYLLCSAKWLWKPPGFVGWFIQFKWFQEWFIC